MCGISGFNAVDNNLLDKMNATTRHRGPDDTGVFVSKKWSLGHNRLSIIDLSRAGHQPMTSRDGKLVISFNGEIYNYQEIRKELESKQYQFTSQTDTEVVLYAYQEWGKECLQKFNGMFALAILNTETEELFLARDRIGIKPLYYYHKGNSFVFASEVKSILEHPVDAPLNYDALNIYFRLLYVPSPQTMWHNIYKLPPAHYATVSSSGEFKTFKYWNLQNESLITDTDPIKQEVSSLLHDSVTKRLVSDRPVGVFLSGGIDSTIIAGIMAKQSNKVQTFSIGFEDTEESEKYNNDFYTARKTAQHFGTQHHEYIISSNDVLDNLEKTIYHMDEPISNHIQTVNMLLARETSTSVKVILGGDGGDELFGGYERYYYNDFIEKIRHIPGARFALNMLGKSSDKLQTQPGVDRYMSFFSQKEKTIASFLKIGNNTAVLPQFLQKRYFQSVHTNDFTRQFMQTDIASWIPDESLLRSDKMSMAFGLEQRVPFLDHRLVEYADRIPVKYKLGKKGLLFGKVGKHYEGKVILREALSEYLPEHVLKQPKWGWFSPAAKWMRGPFKPFMEEVLSETYNEGTRELFDFNALQNMLSDHNAKKGYHLNTLWSVMTFQVWYKQFMK